MANIDLFTRPAKSVPFEDVIAFLDQRYEENIRLDYKADFSSAEPAKELAKDLAAFANTQGGVLLIGIEEERSESKLNAKPKLPAVGRKKTKLSEDSETRIRDVALSLVHVYPPVQLDVHIYPMTSDRELILVQIFSDDEIHWTEGRTGFYVRDGDRCKPVPGTAEQLELLRSRREKIYAYRDTLFREGFQHLNVAVFDSHYGDQSKCPLPLLSLSIVPIVPSKHLATTDRLIELTSQLESRADREWTFPPRTRDEMSGSDRLYLFLTEQDRQRRGVSGPPHFTEIHTNGFIFYAQPFGETIEKSGQSVTTIRDHYILVRLIPFLLFAKRFYTEVGYLGLVSFRLEILLAPAGAYFQFQGAEVERRIVESKISILVEFGIFEFTDGRMFELLIEVYRELVWAGGRGVGASEESLKNKLKTLWTPTGLAVPVLARG
ncbi:MAG: ATP-binding protein [Elusimicrobia bacterium]|nr:ATP-binding protein [Elusimicrobiota bacterium]